MNQDRLKGTLDEVVGAVKRKAGELTHDTPLQVEGIAQQVKGKLENTWGKAKDAVRDAVAEDAREQQDTEVETKQQHLPSDVYHS